MKLLAQLSLLALFLGITNAAVLQKKANCDTYREEYCNLDCPTVENNGGTGATKNACDNYLNEYVSCMSPWFQKHSSLTFCSVNLL